MKGIWTFLLAFSFIATNAQMTTAEESDPAAKRILDKLKKEYDGFKSLEVAFELTMDLPGQGTEMDQGKFIQQGDMFMLEMKDRALYNNGQYAWFVMKKNNEVQINDAEMGEESGIMSPKDMLNLYESGDFVYAITERLELDGVKATRIDFKPLERDSEYSKLSMYINERNNEMLKMMVFSKDGSKFTFRIKDLIPNTKYAAGTFKFDETKYPEMHIEDLRID